MSGVYFLEFLMACGLAFVARAEDQCVRLVHSVPTYEQSMMAQLIGDQPIETPQGTRWIKDRSRGYFATDLELARAFLEAEISRLGFQSFRQTFPLDAGSWLSVPDIKSGTSKENLEQVQKIRALLEQFTRSVTQLLPSESNFTNLIVEIPGTEANAEDVVLMAHYDSNSAVGTWAVESLDEGAPQETIEEYWISPGADDNGSGVVALLSILRHLSLSKQRLKHNLKIVFLDGEESTPFNRQRVGFTPLNGRKGSAYFLSQLTDMQRGNIRVVVNLDTVGSKPVTGAYSAELSHLQYSEVGMLVHQALAGSPLPFYIESNSRSQLVQYSDSIHFAEASLPTLTLSALHHFDSVPEHVNASSDTVDVIDWDSFVPFTHFLWDLVSSVGNY